MTFGPSSGTDFWTLAIIVGMAAVTVITRSFFFISEKPWRMPAWIERGLPYAPVAALSAVIVPEIVITQGHLVSTWQDARIFGAAAGVAVFFWRGNALLTMVVGMAVYLPLHIGLGW